MEGEKKLLVRIGMENIGRRPWEGERERENQDQRKAIESE
jgi:hypothetical protein